MNRWKILLLVAAWAVIGLVGFYLYDRTDSEKAAAPTQVLSTGATDEFNKMRAADKIDDPVQRCLAYPNPVEFDWDKTLVEALCRLNARKMISWKEMSDALDQQHPEILDQAFESYQKRTYEGEHGFLTWSYGMFMYPSSAETALTQHWVDADPSSAYALAARGIHEVSAAFAARGERLTSETPPENFQRMHELADKAAVDLSAALVRAPRLIAAYYGLIQVAQMTGNRELLDDSVKKALALDPADDWIYAGWAEAALPKWGGSIEQENAVVARAAGETGRNPLLKLAKATSICAAATEVYCTACAHNDPAKALGLYRQVASIGPANCFVDFAGSIATAKGDLLSAVRYESQQYRFRRSSDALAMRASHLVQINQKEWAAEDVQRLIKHRPKTVTGLDNLAYAEEALNEPQEAVHTLQRILEIDPKHTDAQIRLSRLYLTKVPDRQKAEALIDGLLKTDPSLALAWESRAIMVCSQSDEECRTSLENFLKFADPKDAYQAREIPRARAKLEELKAQRH